MAFNPDIIFLIDAIDNEEERHEHRLTRRTIRDRSNPLTLPEDVFKSLFRLPRELVRDITEQISPHLPAIARPEIAIPNLHKVLATLHLLANGSYQKSVAQNFCTPMSQQVLSKYIGEVCSAIILHFGHIIKFPSTEQQRNLVKEGFMEAGGFPGIVGAIDCTHIAIQAPPFNDAEMPGIIFLNRKGYYSINTQIVVDAKLKILAISARFPGSVHDSAIYGQSLVRRHLQQIYLEGNHDSWLIGDSGYPLQPFLLTPISGANLTEREMSYNRVHKATRNVIERLNGVLKARFRCLLGHRTLHYRPAVACKIIHTCAILHNMCIERGEEILIHQNHQDFDNEYVGNEPEVGRNWLNEGRQTRERILNMYF